jgi:Spy/CpxP family protein refolding chaperone
MQIRSSRLVWLVPMLSVALGAPLAGGGLGQNGQNRPPQAQNAPPKADDQRGGRPNRGPSTVSWEWWKDKELGLEPLKSARLDRYYNDRQRALQPVMQDWMAQLETLNKMTAERTVDTETYSLQVLRVESLRSKLNESRAVMIYRMYKELSPEQYQKLRQLFEQRRGGRGAGSSPR